MKTMLHLTGTPVPKKWSSDLLDSILADAMRRDPNGDGDQNQTYRQFLLTNARVVPNALENGEVSLQWRCNLPALIKGFPQMPGWYPSSDEGSGGKINAGGKLAFAMGDSSPYVGHRDRIAAVFDDVKSVEVLQKCPHWVHIDKGEELAAVLARWMV